jgi:hypothetical protein
VAVPLATATPEALRAALRPLAEAVAHLPVLAVDAAAAERVRHGGCVPASEGCAGPVVVTAAGDVLAVAEYRDGGYAPLVVLAP